MTSIFSTLFTIDNIAILFSLLFLAELTLSEFVFNRELKNGLLGRFSDQILRNQNFKRSLQKQKLYSAR